MINPDMSKQIYPNEQIMNALLYPIFFNITDVKGVEHNAAAYIQNMEVCPRF